MLYPASAPSQITCYILSNTASPGIQKSVASAQKSVARSRNLVTLWEVCSAVPCKLWCYMIECVTCQASRGFAISSLGTSNVMRAFAIPAMLTLLDVILYYHGRSDHHSVCCRLIAGD